MIKEFIGKGSTLEAATAAAKSGLNVPETADIKIEVIATPKKKFLGLFGTTGEFEVKVSYEDKRDRKPKKKKPQKSAPAKNQDKKPYQNNKNDNKNDRKANEKKADKKTAEQKAERKPEPKAEKKYDTPRKPYRSEVEEKDIDMNGAVAYLKTILDGLDVKEPKINAKFVDGTVEMEIECEDYGIIIGHRGETLDAIQYLTGLAIKNETEKYVRVSLNVGDYRRKREDTLTNLAIKNANYVLRSGRRYIFEPMNPYERRIIHTAVQDVDGVTSRSVGSGMDRKVLIEPEGSTRKLYRSSAPKGRGGSYSNQRRSTPEVDPNRKKVVDRADIPKFGKIEVNNNGE
ncbi:MAG: KH domain-containing protein [Clostridiales bacterium]|nr:KH domain-containing protein [Clostridiales bacterium]